MCWHLVHGLYRTGDVGCKRGVIGDELAVRVGMDSTRWVARVVCGLELVGWSGGLGFQGLCCPLGRRVGVASRLQDGLELEVIPLGSFHVR